MDARDQIKQDILTILRKITKTGGYSLTVQKVFPSIPAISSVTQFPSVGLSSGYEKNEQLDNTVRHDAEYYIAGYVQAKLNENFDDVANVLYADIKKAFASFRITGTESAFVAEFLPSDADESGKGYFLVKLEITYYTN